MGTDFFDDLGETLSRTAREFGERAESIYETQKLRAKISGEERAVGKLMADLGKTLYREYVKGGELTEEQKSLCDQIDSHKTAIERFKAEMAGKKGKKICPSCGESVDKSVSFCPYCGAACPDPEPEEEAGDVVEEPEENTVSEGAEEDSTENTGEDTETPVETVAPGFQEEQASSGAEEKTVPVDEGEKTGE